MNTRTCAKRVVKYRNIEENIFWMAPQEMQYIVKIIIHFWCFILIKGTASLDNLVLSKYSSCSRWYLSYFVCFGWFLYDMSIQQYRSRFQSIWKNFFSKQMRHNSTKSRVKKSNLMWKMTENFILLQMLYWQHTDIITLIFYVIIPGSQQKWYRLV